MDVVPQLPPDKPCGLNKGDRVRVLHAFTHFGEIFTAGEELIFLRESHSIDLGCDMWIFGTDESRRIEESLPGNGYVNGRHLWHEQVHHHCVYGRDGYELPATWLPKFQTLTPSSPSQA
jgi:hypothetical protein